MDRGDTYKVLAGRLDDVRREGYEKLLTRIGRGAVSETVWFHGEPVEVTVEVLWADRKMQKIRVRGSALGPSIWAMERLDESFVMGPNAAVED